MTSGYHLEVAEHYERYPYPSYPVFSSGSWKTLDSVDCSRWGAQIPVRDIWIAGCGTIAPLMFGRRNFAANILGTDLSAAALRICRRRLRIFGVLNVRLKAEDLYESRYEKDFDAIDAYGVVHHTVSPQKSLEILCRALRIGGVLRFMVYSANARNQIEILRVKARERQLKTVDSVKTLLQEEGEFSSGDLSHRSGIADAILNPMVHTFRREALDRLLSQLPELKILKIEDQSNFVVTAIKV